MEFAGLFPQLVFFAGRPWSPFGVPLSGAAIVISLLRFVPYFLRGAVLQFRIELRVWLAWLLQKNSIA